MRPYEANNGEYLLVNASGMISSSENLRSKGFEDYLFLYLDNGCLNINGRTMGTSQAVLIRPGTSFSITPAAEMALTLYWARFTGFGTESILNVCHLPDSVPVNTRPSENAVNEFMLVIKESVHPEYCFRISAAARLTTLMVAFCGNRAGERKNKEISTKKESISSTDLAVSTPDLNSDEKIAQSLDFIHENYSVEISIEKLAEISGLSVSRYRTVFKERMGSSPLDYIIRLRINKAKEIISDGGMTLREVAESVGYDDQLYFSRLFKKRTGIMPSEFVRETKKRSEKKVKT